MPDRSIEGGAAYLREMWSSFAESMPLLRHQLASDAGRDMRARRLDAARGWFSDSIAARGIDVESDAGQRLLRLALLLTSSLAFVDLHDRQGADPATAAADVTWAVEVLADETLGSGR
ncbi:MAG: hypothetical protein ACT4OX_07595 [Actinomycetota bacterium]